MVLRVHNTCYSHENHVHMIRFTLKSFTIDGIPLGLPSSVRHDEPFKLFKISELLVSKQEPKGTVQSVKLSQYLSYRLKVSQ